MSPERHHNDIKSEKEETEGLRLETVDSTILKPSRGTLVSKAVRQTFLIVSLEKVGTIDQDLDVGVIRVSGALLRQLGGRDTLVKISKVTNDGSRVSIVRILRAATGKQALKIDEVALQYDDRRKLGIKRAGEEGELKIEQVGRWLGLPKFLIGHSSPLVRLEAVYAFSLMISGAIIGLVIGLVLGITFS